MDNNYTRADNQSQDETFQIKPSFDYQLRFIHSNDKYRCLSTAFGWGKTETITKDSIYKPLDYYDSIGTCYGAYCGVSFERHLQDVTTKRYFNYYPQSLTQIGKHSIEFFTDNGQTLVKYQLYGIGKQGDINAFASEEFDFIYVDEWTLIPIDNIRFLTTRLRRANRPNMLTLAGIPPVMGSEHHQFLLDNNFTVFSGGADLNPALDPLYYQSLLDSYPPGSQRNRYVYGQICSNDTSMFPYEGIQYNTSPYYKKIVAFIDPAISEKGDEFVIAVQGLQDGLVYNLDCFHATGLHVNNQIDAVKRIQEKWSPHIYAMESNAYQMAGVQIFQKELPHIKGIPSIKDKVTRATNYSMAWGNKKIFWGFKDDNCLQQHMSFPNGKHDDIVDAFAGCYNLLNICQEKTKLLNKGYTNPLTK